MTELAIFPLHTVLFPGMPLRLHIFEERYRQMMHRAIDSDKLFGVCLIRQGVEAYGPPAEPHEIGCTARIIEVERLSDGRMNITALGEDRFRVARMVSSHPYLRAEVNLQPVEMRLTYDLALGLRDMRERLQRYLALLARSAAQQNPADADRTPPDLTQIEIPQDPLSLLYASASILHVPPNEKQPLLEAETLAELFADLQRIYRRELAVLPRMLADDGHAQSAAPLN